MNKYQLNQSPFYKLSNKKKLAELLFISTKDLKQIQIGNIKNKNKQASNDANYRLFVLEDKEKTKKRDIQVPNQFLKKIHKRIANLLSYIETPEYLHSAIKNHSYKTNAEVHIGEYSLAKTDISKFFPSTKFQSIFLFFKNTMFCSLDISTILAKICTFDQHLPTGSPLSPILSFYANKKMFDEIYELCNANNINFTLYVDDLTLSGNGCFKIFGKALSIIRKYGYKTKTEKDIKYLAGYTKEVTGVIIKNNELRLPNERYKKIRLLEEQIKNAKEEDKDKLYKELVGRLREGSQFDKSLNKKISSICKSNTIFKK